MPSAALPNDSIVQRRRAQLRRWINERCDGSQTAFIASTNDGKTQVNQGELSGLLKSKSFGEKRARRLEVQAGMPSGYLDRAETPAIEAREPSADVYGARHVVWPFQVVTYQRILDLKRALGARAAQDALRDVDKYLDVLVSKWEREAAEKRKRGP